MPMLALENLDDVRLDPYRELKPSNAIRGLDGFIAEGKLVVDRLLNSDFEVRSVLVSNKRIASFVSRYPSQRLESIPIWVLPHAKVSELVGFDFHAGIIAHGTRPPQFFDAGDRSDRLSCFFGGAERRTLVACPNTTLPDNLGSIIRLAAAFDVVGLLVTPQSVDPFSRRCVRVSMGNIFYLPTFETHRLNEDFDVLRQQGFKMIACHQSPRSVDLRNFTWPQRVVLVLGNEAAGIPSEVQSQCDHHIEIPIASQVDSLNVSTAAAILMYERSRQR